MSYFQAMETPVIYKHRVAVGLGVENFLGVPFLSLDSHVAVQLEEDKCFGSGQAGQTTSLVIMVMLTGTSLKMQQLAVLANLVDVHQMTIQKQQFHHST